MPASRCLPMGIVFRPLAADDNLNDLTLMLHRAFARLGDLGLNCRCVNQPVAVTRERVAKGECHVAAYQGRLIGTITLCEPDVHSPARWYQRDDVASFHQLAVDPQFQGVGLGDALLALSEAWALQRGFLQLALNTACLADHLLAYYQRRGFRPVETLQFAERNYASVVLAKLLRPELAAPSHIDIGLRVLSMSEHKAANDYMSDARIGVFSSHLNLTGMARTNGSSN